MYLKEIFRCLKYFSLGYSYFNKHNKSSRSQCTVKTTSAVCTVKLINNWRQVGLF